MRKKWFKCARWSDCGTNTDDPDEKIERAFRRGFAHGVTSLASIIDGRVSSFNDGDPFHVDLCEAVDFAQLKRSDEKPDNWYGQNFVEEMRKRSEPGIYQKMHAYCILDQGMNVMIHTIADDPGDCWLKLECSTKMHNFTPDDFMNQGFHIAHCEITAHNYLDGLTEFVY